MDYIWIAFGVQAVVSATFCAVVADGKNRSVPAWIVLGLVFGLYALVAVAGLPPLQEEESFVGGQGGRNQQHREQALEVLRKIQEEKARAASPDQSVQGGARP